MKTKVYSLRRIAGLLVILAFSVPFTGCDEDNLPTSPEPPTSPVKNSIIDFIKSDPDYTILADLLEASTLNTTLSGTASYTILAPTDAAFAKLPEGTLDELTDAQLLGILKYHVINGQVQINTSSATAIHESLHGDPLFIVVDGTTDKINNSATVTGTDQNPSNGIIHEIDEVLLPDAFGTISENIGKRFTLDGLSDLLEELAITGLLEEEGHLTFIIPPSGIYDDLEGWYDMVLTNEQIVEIWKYNMIREDITGIGSGTRVALETLLGDSLYVSMDQPGDYVFNQYTHKIQSASIIHSSNGAIYFVDGLPTPDRYQDVLTLMGKRHYLSTVRSALAVAKMTGRMYNSDNNADEQFTVFMPRNDAQGVNSLPATETELANILKYHMLLEKVTADDLLHNQTYTTWQGEEITITRNGDLITINGTATIKLADLEGTNGVVHVIDGVLTPPAQ
jgi:transforming growth factor-beta-induced protein